MSLETDFQISPENLNPPVESCSAVTRCTDAWNRSFKTGSMRRDPSDRVLREARAAYYGNMPPLVGSDNIRDFVACVAQAILIGAITESQSSRLLYAAQVAQGALRYQSPRKQSA